MIFPVYDRFDVPEEQRHANLETVRRVRGVVARLVESERRQRARGLVSAWCLDRDGLDEAAVALGLPPLLDDEWEAINGPEEPQTQSSSVAARREPRVVSPGRRSGTGGGVPPHSGQMA